MDGVQYLPFFDIISEHFKGATPEEDISLSDFRKKVPEMKGPIFADISTFLRGGGGGEDIIDVILKSKVR